MEQPRIADVVQEEDNLIPPGFVHIEGGGFKKGELIVIGCGTGGMSMHSARMAMLIAAAGMGSPIVIEEADLMRKSLRDAFDGFIPPEPMSDYDYPDPKHPAVQAEERRKNILGPKRGRW